MKRWPWVMAVVALAVGPEAMAGEAGLVPILYTTDLYHPHQDPDDHYDLATLFALPEFDIRGIVIDMGKEGVGRPGVVTLQQMMYLTGREVPYATGLLANLATPDDTAEVQSAETQAGVALILKTLEDAPQPVTVFATGSLRDVAAAFNRAPDLFRAKVARLYVNAGHSSGGEEWNVQLDPAAYVCVLRSGLPVYWVPCLGEGNVQSLWRFDQGEMLDAVPLPLQRFFLYALTQADPAEVDPIGALTLPALQEKKKGFQNTQRNMWCTAPLLDAAGRVNMPFRFNLCAVSVSDDGKTRLVPRGEGVELHVFVSEAPMAYWACMRGALRAALRAMPLSDRVTQATEADTPDTTPGDPVQKGVGSSSKES